MGPGKFHCKMPSLRDFLFKLFSIFIHGTPYFSLQNDAVRLLNWELEFFRTWCHYKMTYKAPFCSGLAATHFVLKMVRGINLASSLYTGATYILRRSNTLVKRCKQQFTTDHQAGRQVKDISYNFVRVSKCKGHLPP